MKQDSKSTLTGAKCTSWPPTNLMAEPDGCVGEGLPLSFKSPPLTVQLGPALLETVPLLQVVGIRQFGDRRRGKAVLQATTQSEVAEDLVC